MHLLDRVRQTIRRHDLARRGTRVVVALSGGSDSVGLAHLLMILDREGELAVAGFAHLNHQLRPSARNDQKFCAALAQALGRPFVAESCDVRALAQADRQSIEEAGHVARYQFFERARASLSADVVALGHTRDDQAETFLLRLLRGAGARGLAAMHPRRDAIVRPLIDCRRAELRAYLDAQQIAFIRDESNDDVSIPRNRVRAELLPLIEDRFNPSIVQVLAAEADVAREEWRWMNAAADEFAIRILRREGSRSLLDAAGTAAAPLALARLVLRRALINGAAGRPVSLTHIDEVLRLCSDGGAPVDLPGQRAERVGSDVVLVDRLDANQPNTADRQNLFRFPLSIPGEVRIVQAGCRVTAEYAQGDAAAERGSGTAIIQLNGSAGPLAVRNRRPGDKFRPFGLGGAKKLQDVFVDRKVARDRRDAVPIVVDESDRIIWVAGHGIDERFQVRDPTQAVVILRLKLGESE